MKQILRKTLFFLLGSLFCGTSWGQVTVPTPVYFNNFSSNTGLEQEGSGEFIDDSDPRFGKIYHNNPIKNKTARTNYLKLPADVLTHSGTTKEITIGFWVNMKDASGENFFHCPVFSAYATSTPGGNNSSPMFRCSAKGVMQLNDGAGHWSDFTKEENDDEAKKTNGNTESTVYLDDAKWHYYTVTLKDTKGAIYVDGNIVNSWTLSADVISGFLGTAASNGFPVVCLGGNQSWDWNDWDASFGYDDFAVYDKALSAEQIAKIISGKLIQGTSIGKLNYSSGYLGEMSTKMTLKPGTSFNYKFINYYGGANWKNWHLVVFAPNGDKKIVLRTDWWDDQNGTTDPEHQRGFSTDPGLNYWDNVPSKMDGAEVDMTITFTSDKKFTMQSRTTKGETSWSYDYTSDYDSTPINLSELNSIDVALSVNGNYLDLLSSGFSVQMGTNGYATYASPYPLDLTTLPSGLTAYKATIDGSIVRFTAISQKVAPNNGFLLKGTPSQAYTIPVTNSGSIIADNAFMVNASGNTFDGPGYTHYGMIKDSNPLKFGVFDPDEVAIPGNKAYLRVSTSTARELIAVFDDDEITGIGDVRNNITDNKGDFYNLNGQKVLNPTKGLYIVNGKKVIIK